MADETRSQNTPKETLRPLRTFESDAAEAMRSGHISIAKIAVSEIEKPKSGGDFIIADEPKDPAKKRLIIAAALIVILSAAAIIGAFVLFQPKPKPPPPVISGRPIINVDQEKAVDVSVFDGERIVSAIVQERKRGVVRLNTIESIRLFKKTVENGVEIVQPLKSAEFFSKVAVNAPASFARSLSDNFVLGILAYDGNQPFLIFKTATFDYAYAGMLKWENTISEDLGAIFSENGISPVSTTSQNAFGTPFSDLIVDNLDTRVRKEANGKISMIYSFIDEATLVITTDPKTFSILFQKILTTRMTK